jgi:uncharacterized protein DUF664
MLRSGSEAEDGPRRRLTRPGRTVRSATPPAPLPSLRRNRLPIVGSHSDTCRDVRADVNRHASGHRYHAPMTVHVPAAALARTEPDPHTDERQALEDWVDYHRATLLTKCQGLAAEQLKLASAPPSKLTLLGLIRHMTIVERWWFRMHAAREEIGFLYTTDEWLDADFEDLDDADAGENIADFIAECETCRRAVRDLPLTEVVNSRGDHPERTTTLRWIYLHMIEEYARHNGHADLLRERIDGATGE